MSDTGPIDPASLSLADLRAERSALQDADDVVSYVRRAAQARLDLARAEAARRVLAAQGVAQGLVACDIYRERQLFARLQLTEPGEQRQRPLHENMFRRSLEQFAEARLPADVVAALHHVPHVLVGEQRARRAAQTVQQDLQYAY